MSGAGRWPRYPPTARRSGFVRLAVEARQLGRPETQRVILNAVGVGPAAY